MRIEQADGISYSVLLRGKEVIAASKIDLKVVGHGWLGEQASEPSVTERSETEKVEFVVPRKFRQLDTKYNQIELEFADGTKLVFRAYDEGVAYRWATQFPGEITVEDELAQFIFPGQPNAWFPEEESIQTHQDRVYTYVSLAEIVPERFCSTDMLVHLNDGP